MYCFTLPRLADKPNTSVYMSLVLVLMMLVTAMAKAEHNAVVFESTETPPYWSADLPDHGVGGAMLAVLSEAAGVEYSIKYLPVKRFRNSSSTYIVGDPDLLTQQKQRVILPFGIFHSAFFYYKPRHVALELNSLDDMRGLTLGVLRGTLEDKKFFTSQGIQVEESDTVESLLKKLRKGRIDICILVAGAGEYTIKKIFPAEADAFVKTIIPGLSRPIAIMVDISDPEGKAIAQRYRNVLDSVIQSQKYQQVLERFYGKDKIPSTRAKQLNKFIQYYASNWGD